MRKRFEKIEDIYCPNCGTKDSIWEDTESEDYYQGCEHHCVSCTWQGYDLYFYDDSNEDILNLIKEQE